MTSTLITVARKKVVEDDENPRFNLAQVPCIRYPINFKKKSMLELLDLGSKVNAINPIFTKEPGFPIKPTDVGMQKIDGIMLDTNGIVVVAFLMIDKTNRVKFFEKTFLVANISLKVVLGMLFFTLSSVDIDFLDLKLR